MIGVLPRYNILPGLIQYYEMPATINVRYFTRYMVQYVRYSPKYISGILPTTKCQVSYLGMLGT